MLRICFAIDTLDRHYRYLTSPSCAMRQMEIESYDIKNYDENFIEKAAEHADIFESDFAQRPSGTVYVGKATAGNIAEDMFGDLVIYE